MRIITKIAAILLSMLIYSISVNAQERFFDCSEFLKDVADIGKAAENETKAKSLAEKIKALGHLNEDGEIQYCLVLK